MSRLPRLLLTGMTAAAVLGGTAMAQLLPSLPLPSVPVVGGVLRDVSGSQDPNGSQRGQVPIVRSLDSLGVPEPAALAADTLLDLRKLRLRQLVRDNRRVLDMDGEGNPVRRGELLAIDPDAASLAAARNDGFQVLREEGDPSLGLRVVVLGAPARLGMRDAMKRLRVAAPRMDVDYNHLFEPAGGALAASTAALAASSAPSAPGKRIAVIDGGVAAHPSFAGASIEQRAFAGQARATGHGTAVASLLVGEQGRFRGAARGASLFVADVYGGDQTAGSATVIVRALAWAATKRPDVINISLVGPSNRILQRAVAILASRGVPMVAAVGNDGPAAPLQYPASYPGVVPATAVDARDRALPEAGRTAVPGFAAPGADMAAALPGKGYSQVRGTSFAAPLVAARLAATGSVNGLAAEAVKGKGRIGRGIVCKSCRIDPKTVGAK